VAAPPRWKVVYASALALGAVVWLAAVAATGLTLGGPSPPRALPWTGSDPTPPEDRGLPELLVLEQDAAWFIAQRSLEGHGATLDVARLDLPAGVARRDWPLPPSCALSEGYLHVRGLAHDPESGDLWLALGVDGRDRWLCAVHLRADGGLVDLGRADVADQSVLATSLRTDGLDALTWGCETVRFRASRPPTVTRIANCPDPATRPRLVAATAEGDGWRLIWDTRLSEEGLTRRTRGPDGPAEIIPAPEVVPARDLVPAGGLGYGYGRHSYDKPKPARPPEAPPDMRARYADKVLRSDGAALRRAVTLGGFWHWCLELPASAAPAALCIEHDPHAHTATWTAPGGATADDVATTRWDPADPVLLPASAGGAWLLDHSHTALDGRVYLRLDPTTLERLDPLSALERFDRVLMRTRADLDALMATGGPSGASLPSDPDELPGVLFRATLALPLGLLAFPILVALGVTVQAIRRRRPRLVNLPVAIGAGIYLLLALAEGDRFAKLLSWL